MPNIVIYTKETCPYCVKAKQILLARGVQNIDEIRVDLDGAKLEEMMNLTHRRTVPQIFIGGKHIGGCDDLLALDADGKLTPLLKE